MRCADGRHQVDVEARRPPGEAFGSAFWLGDDPDAAPLAVVYAADRLDAGDCDAVIQVAEGVQARWGETWRDLQQLTLTVTKTGTSTNLGTVTAPPLPRG